MLNSKSTLRFLPVFFASLVLIIVLDPTFVTAQKIELLNGTLDVLKGQKSYNIIFSYDSMLVGVDIAEKPYLKEKRRVWEMKEAGKGDAFVNQWYSARQEHYEPTFIQNFESASGIKLNDKNAKYMLILKTTRTEGGWNAGIMTHASEIEGELWIVESQDQNKVIGKIGFNKFTGKSSGGDFEMTSRIDYAYGVAGEGLGKFLKRKTRSR